MQLENKSDYELQFLLLSIQSEQERRERRAKKQAANYAIQEFSQLTLFNSVQKSAELNYWNVFIDDGAEGFEYFIRASSKLNEDDIRASIIEYCDIHMPEEAVSKTDISVYPIGNYGMKLFEVKKK